LIDGWFENTLGDFKKIIGDQSIDLLHLDADTYTPTALVLDSLVNSNLRKGSIIIFDEFFGYPGWENHEFKAWNSFIRVSRRKYTYLASAPHQVAIRMDD
jgi:predicted O-methyltransferase YrrM